LSQPRFLPVIQTISLALFVIVALHHRNVRGAIILMALWLPIQFVTMTLLTALFTTQVEAAFSNGFVYRAEIAAWFFAGANLPGGFVSEPLTYFLQLLVVFAGSLATAGVVGIWSVLRMVNQAAYGTGLLIDLLTNPASLFLVIPYWTLLRAAGYAGLAILCAIPLLTYQWSPRYYWQHHRRLILATLALLLLAFLLELFLPGLVARPPLT
jgi:hypothetical protein